MPYLHVAHPPQAEVFASAERRWQALIDAQPDLQAAVSLQRTLLTHVIDLARTIEGGPLPRLSLPPKYVAAKLLRGVPVLLSMTIFVRRYPRPCRPTAAMSAVICEVFPVSRFKADCMA